MKYIYELVCIDTLDGIKYYTYNVYQKWFCFYKIKFLVSSDDQEYCIKKCEEYIKSKKLF